MTKFILMAIACSTACTFGDSIPPELPDEPQPELAEPEPLLTHFCYTVIWEADNGTATVDSSESHCRQTYGDCHRSSVFYRDFEPNAGRWMSSRCEATTGAWCAGSTLKACHATEARCHSLHPGVTCEYR